MQNARDTIFKNFPKYLVLYLNFSKVWERFFLTVKLVLGTAKMKIPGNCNLCTREKVMYVYCII